MGGRTLPGVGSGLDQAWMALHALVCRGGSPRDRIAAADSEVPGGGTEKGCKRASSHGGRGRHQAMNAWTGQAGLNVAKRIR